MRRVHFIEIKTLKINLGLFPSKNENGIDLTRPRSKSIYYNGSNSGSNMA